MGANTRRASRYWLKVPTGASQFIAREISGVLPVHEPEFRIPKPERSPNSEFRRRELRRGSGLRPSGFGFLSDFGLRNSDFRFRGSMRESWHPDAITSVLDDFQFWATFAHSDATSKFEVPVHNIPLWPRGCGAVGRADCVVRARRRFPVATR